MTPKTYCGDSINPQFGRSGRCSADDWQCDNCRTTDLQIEVDMLYSQLSVWMELSLQILGVIPSDDESIVTVENIQRLISELPVDIKSYVHWCINELK